MPEKKKNPAVGIFDDIPFDEYCKIPAINNSGLKNFHHSPAHYLQYKLHPKPTTGNFLIGQAIHCLTMEPNEFSKQFIQGKYTSNRTNEAKAWNEAAAEEGLKVLSVATDPGKDPYWNPSEWDLVHRTVESLLANPIANLLLNGIIERTIIWVDKGTGNHKGTGKLCKARMDCYNEDHSMIVDLKSAVDASLSGFAKAINNYGYYRQHAWYMEGARSEDIQLDVHNGFTFVVVEKAPPYGVAMYRLEREWVRVGETMNHIDIDNFKVCHDEDNWPCYTEDIRDQPMPGYAKFHDIS